MTVIAIPEIITKKLSQEGAEALAQMLNDIEQSSTKHIIHIAEQRFERRLAQEIGKFRAEVIKWMFIFLFGHFWATLGAMYVLFK